MTALLAAAGGIEIPVGVLAVLFGVVLTGTISLVAWLTKQMLELSRHNAVLATKLEQQTELVGHLTSRVEALVAQVRQLEIYGMQWQRHKGSD